MKVCEEEERENWTVHREDIDKIQRTTRYKKQRGEVQVKRGEDPFVSTVQRFCNNSPFSNPLHWQKKVIISSESSRYC